MNPDVVIIFGGMAVLGLYAFGASKWEARKRSKELAKRRTLKYGATATIYE